MTVFSISADSHVTETAETYGPHMVAKFRDQAPYVRSDPERGDLFIIPGMKANSVPVGLIAGAGKKAEELNTRARYADLHAGGWDPHARLADQDRDGIGGEILYPTVGMVLCNHPDLDYKKACFDAYNLWIAEYSSAHPERLFGIGQTAMRTPEEGIEDLQRIKSLGLRGVMMPGDPGVEDYDSKAYDAFYDAALELGMPLSFHILTSSSDGIGARGRGPKLNRFLSIIRGNQDIIGTFILGGVFDRHPRLKIVCVEADAGWVPHYMYRMDHAYDRHRFWLPAGADLQKMPSEYFRENVYTTFQDDWVAFQMTKMVNPERLMWANDFPHSDATWPRSQEVLEEHTKHLSAWEKQRILTRQRRGAVRSGGTQRMKAVCFVEKGRVAVEDRPRPNIQEPTDAVVRITKAAICGSDLHFYHGRLPMNPGFVIGHEMLGIVEDVGREVHGVKAGDRVVVSDLVACGSCWYCRRRYFVNCVSTQTFGGGEKMGNLPGGQADFVRVPFADTTCGLAPAGLSDEQALFVGDILVTGYTCAKNAAIQPGDTVVVVGCGPVGMFAQMCARLYGPACVIAVDMVPSRLALAKEMGSIPVDGSDPKAARKTILELTDGRGADAVMEAVGVESALQTACMLVRPKGTISIVGAFSGAVAVPAPRALFGEWTIRFGLGDSPRYRDEVFALIAGGRLQPERIISHRMKLEDTPRGYEMFDRREAFKIVLTP